MLANSAVQQEQICTVKAGYRIYTARILRGLLTLLSFTSSPSRPLEWTQIQSWGISCAFLRSIFCFSFIQGESRLCAWSRSAVGAGKQEVDLKSKLLRWTRTRMQTHLWSAFIQVLMVPGTGKDRKRRWLLCHSDGLGWGFFSPSFICILSSTLS